jgi:DNA-binding CsgD family transcriptional regulator
MKLGAVDLLSKPFSAEALVAAVGRAIESARRTDEAHRALAALWRLVGRLTPREAEVCALVASGSPNKNVAARIGTTEKTVKVHRGRVMHKLGAQSLAELVRLVDRVIAEPDRRAIRLDGAEITRPSAVDILVRVVAQVRSTAAARAAGNIPLLIEPLGPAGHRPSVNS